MRAAPGAEKRLQAGRHAAAAVREALSQGRHRRRRRRTPGAHRIGREGCRRLDGGAEAGPGSIQPGGNDRQPSVHRLDPPGKGKGPEAGADLDRGTVPRADER